MKHDNSKPRGHSKSNDKREVYSNTSLPQESRKTLSKQSNLTPKATRKRRAKNKQTNKKPPKLVEGKKS